MDLDFLTVAYDPETFLDSTLPGIPKSTAVYRIFDTRGRLIVLNKTSNLSQRLERYFGPHSERVKDLDLRQITSRIEYVRTFSPFETAYALYLDRRRHFPKSYRKMRTFRYFTLMKINRKQRFPRIYASRQIKTGVDYFGPLVTRGQFLRMKTTLERTFKLRPCQFNIRGNDPHPDCMYFQMHTCSKPCNNDIDRKGYLEDVDNAAAFIQGRDEWIEQALTAEMTQLASETKFEEAELVRRQIEKLKRARQEMKESFFAVSEFNQLVVLPSETASQIKIAVVNGGSIVSFRDYETAEVRETLAAELAQCFKTPHVPIHRDWQYDEFCLVCSFMVKSLLSVQVIPFQGIEDTVAAVEKNIRPKRNRRSAPGSGPGPEPSAER